MIPAVVGTGGLGGGYPWTGKGGILVFKTIFKMLVAGWIAKKFLGRSGNARYVPPRRR
jgi:hypothetical protein